MKRILILLSLVATNIYAEKAVEIKGSDIRTLRTHTNLHWNSGARNVVVVKVAGLEDGCTEGVFFPEDGNDATLSLVLAARVSNQDIRLAYEPNTRAPWGDTKYCALTYFDIQ